MADDFNSQYSAPLFGAGGNWASTGLGGSQATDVPNAAAAYDTTGTTMTTAYVVPAMGSTVNGDRVPVGPLDTLVSPQADLYTGPDANPLTAGMSGDQVGHTGIGGGHTHFGGGSAS